MGLEFIGMGDVVVLILDAVVVEPGGDGLILVVAKVEEVVKLVLQVVDVISEEFLVAGVALVRLDVIDQLIDTAQVPILRQNLTFQHE